MRLAGGGLAGQQGLVLDDLPPAEKRLLLHDLQDHITAFCRDYRRLA